MRTLHPAFDGRTGDPAMRQNHPVEGQFEVSCAEQSMCLTKVPELKAIQSLHTKKCF